MTQAEFERLLGREATYRDLEGAEFAGSLQLTSRLFGTYKLIDDHGRLVVEFKCYDVEIVETDDGIVVIQEKEKEKEVNA